MAAAASGIWSHHIASAQAVASAKANPMTGPGSGTGGTGGSSTSGSDSATISANDFLTLLVTEMQNQDPTADTDPNEYINQLVNVNSLEQLISINQNLSTALGVSSSTSSASSAVAGADGASNPAAAVSATGAGASGSRGQAHAAARQGGALAGIQSFAASSIAAKAGAAEAPTGKHAAGNLSVPPSKPASQRVAQALNGRHTGK